MEARSDGCLILSLSYDTAGTDENDAKDCCLRWTGSYVVWMRLTLGSVGAR